MALNKALVGLVLVAAPALVALWSSACGPSVQTVYEGNVRFEHCYRLDLDPNIAAGHREACWRSYTHQYHYGQTRDRIEYARRRIRALAAGDTSRPTLVLDAGDDAESVSPAEAPTPTSVHAPPPPTARVASADSGPDAADAASDGGAGTRAPPGAECADKCTADWKECGGPPCQTESGKPGAKPGNKVARACAACERDFRRCMQRCFR